MALQDICTNCKKNGDCEVPCKKIEEILTADTPQKKPKIEILSDQKIIYKNGVEQTIDIDNCRNIDPAIAVKKGLESDLDRNFDKGPSFEPTGLVMDDKTRANLSEYTRRCHHKEKKFKKYLFNAFLRCNTIKKIASEAGKKEQVIQKYLARICKCIVDWIIRRYEESNQEKIDLPSLVLTPLKFKNKFIVQ